jgi:predicted nucleic acid-binding protein
MIYLDSSALVKLVHPEAESATLQLWLAERAGMPRVTSGDGPGACRGNRRAPGRVRGL